MESEENFSCHQSTIDGREFHEKRYQTHKNEISHFAIEMLSQPTNHIEACVPNKNYIYEKHRPHSDLWDFKKCAFLLAVECAEVSYFNSTSVICFINKTMLDVYYRSRECLNRPQSYHMEILTYVLQNIATNKMMFSRSNTNDPV